MVCANWSLTALGVLIFAFAVWPANFATEMTIQWVVGISSILIVVVAWTMVICKPCMARNNKIPEKGKKK